MSKVILPKLSRPSQPHRPAWTLVIVISVLILVGMPAFAQLTTADIVGTVRDSSGAVVNSANVTLLRLETHQSTKVSTDSFGNFAFTSLVPGHYSVKVQAAGFKSVTVPDLAVEAGDRARADATLPVGQSTETVEVVAQTPLLQTDNATVSSTITDTAVQDLPLNGRNFVQLVQLVPGANEGPGNGLTSGGRPDDRRPTNGFSVNAFDDTLNNQIIDGIDNNERIIGTIGVKPSIDAIQEVTVETNNYAPEIGRTAGGVVNVITKSGTNKFHGSLFEFFRNDIFDTRSAFATAGAVPKPKLEQNQFGGSIGGPIVKDRTFFFADYEGSRIISGTTYTSTVPSIDQYNRIHSLNGHTPQEQVALGNGTATYSVDPIALNYLKLYPAPNLPGDSSNFVTDPNKTQNSDTLDGRVDHKFNNSNNLYVRYTHNKVVTNNPAQLPNVVDGLIAGGGRWNFSGAATDKADQIAINYTHVFTQNTLVQLRAAYTRINNLSLPLNAGTNGDSKVGWTGNTLNGKASGLTPIGINGFPDLGDGAYVPLQDIDNSYQYDGFVSYHHGRHDMKFGAGLIRRQARNIQSAFPFGQYSFGLSSDSLNPNSQIPTCDTTCQNNNVLASTLVGAFTAQSYNVDINVPDYRSWEPSVFVQDTWKATRWLTLVYGVRYDVYTPFTEAHNHISNFDFNAAVAGGTAAAAQAALKVAGVGGVSNTADIKTDYTNFSPRFGFSAQIAPGTVLRGGIGLSFFPGNYTSNADLKNAPFVSVFSPSCVSARADAIILAATGSHSPNGACDGTTTPTDFGAGMPLPTSQTITSDNLSFIAQDPKFRSGVATQFNLLLQKAFGPNVVTIGYVGVHGSHLPETLNDINEPAPTDFTNQARLQNPNAPDTNLPRPLNTVLSNLGGVNWLVSGGVSNYSGLQTSFQRRLASGLTASLNYTWSHALSDVTGMSEEGQEGWGNGDPRNIRKYEYGNADNDIRHRFAGTATYVLPFGKNLTGAKKMLLGGWQTNAILAWQTGHPFTVVNNASDDPLFGYGNRAHGGLGGSGGVDRPNMYALGHGVPIQEWNKNTSRMQTIPCISGFGHDFCPQTMGTVGNERRNALYGPHFRHLDMSLFKDFPIKESLKVQFRTEVFNISNTPNYFINNNVNSSPATLLGNADFGKTKGVDPNYVPRQFQFVIKILF